MATRLDLQTKLEELFGNRHVYYQPAENLQMEYPAIRYSKSDIIFQNGDNIKYMSRICYDITVIDEMPDNAVINKILELPYSSFDRHYKANNFNHDVIKLYF